MLLTETVGSSAYVMSREDTTKRLSADVAQRDQNFSTRRDVYHSLDLSFLNASI